MRSTSNRLEPSLVQISLGCSSQANCRSSIDRRRIRGRSNRVDKRLVCKKGLVCGDSTIGSLLMAHMGLHRRLWVGSNYELFLVEEGNLRRTMRRGERRASRLIPEEKTLAANGLIEPSLRRWTRPRRFLRFVQWSNLLLPWISISAEWLRMSARWRLA